MDVKTILIAEDDSLQLMLLLNLLSDKKGDYKFVTAEDGQIAYDMALSHLPDLIIMDWEMPKMSGIEVVEKLKANEITQHIPVLLLTAKDSDVYLEEALESGAADFLNKSFSKVELYTRINAVLKLNELNKKEKEYIEQIKKQNKELLTFNESKDRILNAVAHDLRTPIYAIQGIINMMKMEEEFEGNEDLSMMDMSCTNALTLVKELLDIAELEDKSFELELEKTEINEFIKSIIYPFQEAITKKQLQFNFDFKLDKIFVNINTSKFERVLSNLVSNAIKFTPDKGKISIHTSIDEGELLIIIKDSGIGVPAKLQPIIFDKFSKARRLGLEGERSTGLGMSIVKQIVSLHNGKLWLESVENEGASFFIALPKPIIE